MQTELCTLSPEYGRSVIKYEKVLRRLVFCSLVAVLRVPMYAS